MRVIVECNRVLIFDSPNTTSGQPITFKMQTAEDAQLLQEILDLLWSYYNED